MAVNLGAHFTFRKLLKAILPVVLMQVFVSIYSVVDGFFVSNFVGKTAFAAVNLIMPVPMIAGSLGFMIGAGGSALVAKTMGEGDKEKANQLFSMMVFFAIILAASVTAILIPSMPIVAKALGADEKMLPLCVLYGDILVGGIILFTLQNLFQTFFMTAQKPMLGFFITVGAGLTNIILDGLLVGVFKMGIAGAAAATVIAEAIGAGISLIYFIDKKNDSLLHLSWAKLEIKPLLKAVSNGSSEFLTNVSVSVVNIVYNHQLMSFFGENGVSAYGVLMYVWMIFAAIFVGYNIASSPIIAYNYGAKNHGELHNMFWKSLVFLGVCGVAMFGFAEAMSYPLSMLFTSYDRELFNLTLHAFIIYAIIYLTLGINMWTSAFFTALNNGLVSLLVSLARVLVFQLISILVLPLIFGAEGLWWAIVVAELLGFLMCISFLFLFRKKYGY